MPDYALEAAHGGLVVGIDEVGRGPLAGPVVAAAVAFVMPPDEVLSSLLDDSKKLSAKRRERALEALFGFPEALIGVGAASVSEIEHINIGQACHLAMRRALSRLGATPDLALVDGRHAPKLPCPVKMVVRGDSVSLSIAAASIVAKVTRDRLMTRLAARYDAYGWERNAGYGTAAHLRGLHEQGVTVHHRRSFAPIKTIIEAEARAA